MVICGGLRICGNLAPRAPHEFKSILHLPAPRGPVAILTILPLCIHLDEAISDGLKSAERVKKSIQKFQSLVEVTAASNRAVYSAFAQKVVGK